MRKPSKPLLKKQKRILLKPQTIEEYNSEIKIALLNAEHGKVISMEKLEKEMQSW